MKMLTGQHSGVGRTKQGYALGKAFYSVFRKDFVLFAWDSPRHFGYGLEERARLLS